MERIKKVYGSTGTILDRYPHNRSYEDIRIPKTRFLFNEEGIEEFNEVYNYIKSVATYCTFPRTEKGYICKSMKSLLLDAYDVKKSKNSLEITALLAEGHFRFIIGTNNDDEMSGSRCYTLFRKICEEAGVDLKEHMVENGEDYKKQIPAPMISLEGEENKVYEHAWHADINSSYMAGIAFANPDLEPVIQKIYSLRKTDKKYKDILTHTYGFMQSRYCGDGNHHKYALANLSLQAHLFNNETLSEMARKAVEGGAQIIAFNTDGFWAVGPELHTENEGTALGQYKIDHRECTLRFKSKGSYEFMENGKYTPVVRGATKLDRVKRREFWQWGNIYQDDAEALKYNFDWNIGVYHIESEEK